jgi:hypothetical protein
MALSWKFLLPLSVINLVATALEVYFLRDAQGILATGDLWLMAAINIGIGLVSILLFGSLVREKVRGVRPQSYSVIVGGAPVREVR